MIECAICFYKNRNQSAVNAHYMVRILRSVSEPQIIPRRFMMQNHHPDEVKRCPASGCKFVHPSTDTLEEHIVKKHRGVPTSEGTGDNLTEPLDDALDDEEPTKRRKKKPPSPEKRKGKTPSSHRLCAECGYNADSATALAVHTRRMHTYRACAEEGCTFSTYEWALLSRHIRTAHRARCGICHFVPGRGRPLEGHDCQEHLGK